MIIPSRRLLSAETSWKLVSVLFALSIKFEMSLYISAILLFKRWTSFVSWFIKVILVIFKSETASSNVNLKVSILLSKLLIFSSFVYTKNLKSLVKCLIPSISFSNSCLDSTCLTSIEVNRLLITSKTEGVLSVLKRAYSSFFNLSSWL
jgi:hypothetical protein